MEIPTESIVLYVLYGIGGALLFLWRSIIGTSQRLAVLEKIAAVTQEVLPRMEEDIKAGVQELRDSRKAHREDIVRAYDQIAETNRQIAKVQRRQPGGA